MEPSLNKQTHVNGNKKRSASRFVWSFVWMVLFTALSFYLVAYPHFTTTTTFWIILGAAVMQVFLQLYTFMHLDEKGHTLPIIFISLGLFIAVISVVGLILM
ncbi:cytochrome C oxidase subunit IV family protein [Shimazuella sp. AN120528]|uniref:cytochrome C oxidase subunit IV family protein n=1 Tax=Shimazuella soli TaxID=1892854 RepID=UPI001F0ED433|nr:cytochrome C oxidase subunit IV family protein [Shimazuella soli]